MNKWKLPKLSGNQRKIQLIRSSKRKERGRDPEVNLDFDILFVFILKLSIN